MEIKCLNSFTMPMPMLKWLLAGEDGAVAQIEAFYDKTRFRPTVKVFH